MDLHWLLKILLCSFWELYSTILLEKRRKIVVLGATSGDTGAAAISACSRYENVEVYILYPNGKVTEFQRKQMKEKQLKKCLSFGYWRVILMDAKTL